MPRLSACGAIIARFETFAYAIGENYTSRAMTGAGIFALAHAGQHDTPERTSRRQTAHLSFAEYNGSPDGLDRYHYSLFHSRKRPTNWAVSTGTRSFHQSRGCC